MNAFDEDTEHRPWDDPHLAPLNAGGCRIGWVDEIHGEGSTAVPGFAPTRAELLLLTRYYRQKSLDFEYEAFADGTVSSTGMRMDVYALQRINRIAEHLGKEPVDAAIGEATVEYGEGITDPHTRDVFLHGTEAERELVREELQSHLEFQTRREQLRQQRLLRDEGQHEESSSTNAPNSPFDIGADEDQGVPPF